MQITIPGIYLLIISVAQNAIFNNYYQNPYSVQVGNLRKPQESKGNTTTFKFVTPVVYQNSFLDMEDDNSEIENLEDSMSNDIDKYYENMNEFLGDE